MIGDEWKYNGEIPNIRAMGELLIKLDTFTQLSSCLGVS